MADLYANTEMYSLLDTEKKFAAVKRNRASLIEGKNISTMPDVSIGTGSMTLPVCELGAKLSGSDLSRDMPDHLERMSYTDIQLMCLPVEMPGRPEDADWYCVMARKPE